MIFMGHFIHHWDRVQKRGDVGESECRGKESPEERNEVKEQGKVQPQHRKEQESRCKRRRKAAEEGENDEVTCNSVKRGALQEAAPPMW